MIENPMVSGQGYEESYVAPVGRCEECNKKYKKDHSHKWP